MRFHGFIITICSIILALIFGAVIIVVSKHNPLDAYEALFNGSFGSLNAITETLRRATPLILTGLAVSFAFKGGLFNIGGEGQFIIGGLCASVVAFGIKGLPSIVHIPMILVAAIIGGGVYGAIPGWLKAKLGVHEVINTIMLNWIALYIVSFLVNNPLKDPSGLGTPLALPSASFPILVPDSRLHIGLLIAVISAIIIWFVLAKTTFGYETKGIGFSGMAAEYGGIPIGKRIVQIMAISGAMAGLAGAMEYVGVLGRIESTLWFSGYGFQGIAVSLVGKNDPFGVILSSILFGALGAGGHKMELVTDISKEITLIIQALVILFVVAPDIVKGVIPIFKKNSFNLL